MGKWQKSIDGYKELFANENFKTDHLIFLLLISLFDFMISKLGDDES